MSITWPDCDSLYVRRMSTDPPEPITEIQRADFGRNFVWGCATSAYQVEGAASEDGRVSSIWDDFCAKPGNVRDGSDGAAACAHYKLWRADLDLCRNIGLNAYRFSIAWPRIFSARGSMPNAKGLAFYSRLVDGMLERGLQPWATLYHWDLPSYLQAEGGWLQRDTVDAFAEFAHVMSVHLGDRVKQWITHNEPWCTAMLGNFEGVHAPGIRNFRTALQVSHHLLLSHGRAVAAIRSNAAQARVGIALSLHPLYAVSNRNDDREAMVRYDGLRNRWFLDPLHGRGYPADVWEWCRHDVPHVEAGDLATIAVPTDFLGVNYYFPEAIADAPGSGPLGLRVVETKNVDRTAFGWEVSPIGLATLLKRVAEEYQPTDIYITENGSTYDDIVASDGEIHDEKRRSYLIRHLRAARDALDQGIPVRGYFAWSLLDNFEWAEGYTRRFGLAHVDFATQRRQLKASGKWYRAFLHQVDESTGRSTARVYCEPPE